MNERIIYRHEGNLGLITLNAGDLNVLNIDDVKSLETAVRALSACTVILIDAAGSRAFCAGMDIADHTPDRAPAMLAAFAEMALAFEESAAVLVAKIGAPAMGGGFEIVLLCDLAIASEHAQFALPEVKLAALPPVACGLLPKIAGNHRAADLILTGRRIDAVTAEQWGIVTRVVSHVDLDNAAHELCRDMLSLSGNALRYCKRAIQTQSTEAALRIYTDELLKTHDAAEGIYAFLHRRAPKWETAK